jgi:hypothetical protein
MPPVQGTFRGAGTLAAYLLHAVEQAMATSLVVPVYDPTSRFAVPRRIAARFGGALDQVASDDGSHVDAAALLREIGALPAARPEHLVVMLAEDDSRYPATVFARYRRCSLVHARTAEEIAAHARALDARYVTLFGPPRAVRFDLLAQLRRELGPRVAVGVFTAATTAALSELVAKNLFYPTVPAGQDAFLAPLEKGPSVHHSGPLTSYLGEACTPEVLASDGAVRRVLSLLTHGREDFLKVGRHMLCGRDTGAAVPLTALPRAVPACMQGFECVRPDLGRLDPAQVPAQVVFVNACLSLKFGVHLFGDRFGVARRFLDGWTAVYVANPLLKAGAPMENLLFHHLVDAGLTIGEAVSVVNENVARVGRDAPAFMVVGDVEAVYGNAGMVEPADSTVSVEHDRVVVELKAVVPRFAAFSIRDQRLLQRHRRDGLEAVPVQPFGGRTPVAAALYDAGDCLRIFLCGVEETPITEHGGVRRLAVRVPCADSEDANPLLAIRRYEALPDLGLRLPQGKPVLVELATLLPVLIQRVSAARVDLTKAGALAKSIDRFRASFDKLDAELLSVLLKLTESRSYHFVEAYREAYAVEDVRIHRQPCPYCGEVVYEYRSQHLLRTDLWRAMHCCPTCGAIRDFDNDRLAIDIEGVPVLYAGTPNVQLIQLANRGPELARVLVGARVSKGASDGFRFDPDREVVTLGPGDRRTVAVTVTPGAAPLHHAVLLRAYAVSRGRISFAGRDLWLRPKTERRSLSHMEPS